MNKTLTIMAISLGMIPLQAGAQTKYPAAPKDNTVDTYFGTKVPDPYRPLENDTAAATTAWVKAENAVTRAYLDAVPFRSAIRERLTQLNNYRKQGLPTREADGKYYYYVNDGLRNQSVLYRAKDAEGTDAEVFLDPNTLSDDGTVALTGVSMSPDGKYMAYTVSRSGSDWTEIYVMDPVTGKLLDDHIVWAKFTGVAWDGDGFYYSAYPAPEAGKEFSNANEFHRVYYHKMGTPQSADTVAFEDLKAPLHFHSAWTPDDASALVIEIGGQGNGNALKIKQLHKPGAEWVSVVDDQQNTVNVIDIIDGTVYMLTSLDAPNYRVVAAPLADPRRQNWREIIPESDNVLVGVDVSADKLIATYLKDASHHAYVHSLKDGKRLGEIALPGYGSVAFSTSRKYPEVLYRFASFTTPGQTYAYDAATGKSALKQSTAINGIDSDAYVTEQVFYPSADGTRIPMFITHKKGIELNGKNPTYLYGYGGFNISLEPSFSANRMLWLENGGIYAQANLRGGGEYGEKWHEAGTLQQKQNVFDDFAAAARYLIDKGYTSPSMLTIEGGSNGGLLVGATVNQHPELFAVAIPRVGVMDMMRYHLFTIGWNWAHDYGTSADSPEMAQYLLKYSPLHNIQSGPAVKYPAIMVTTADHDDRVVPAHSFKYAATLQAAQTGDKPKLIRIDSKAGHGAGKPISKVIDEYTDIYTFIYSNLGIDPTK
ncbi:MAG: prolyl oligopeptidase family serine peptidase [Muribaculaceae bacterium]|nr:prolyl oligopeptidase family serine peptidase [Muribaculaceae bacterium]